MTDYSTAIFGLIAFTAVVSAAVVYVLAQPSDLTGCEKSKISSKLSSVLPFWTKNMTTQDLLVLLVSFGTACFALNIYKLNQEPQQ